MPKNTHRDEEKCKYGHTYLESSLSCLECGASRATVTEDEEEWEKEFDKKWPHLEMWTEHAKPMQCERAIKDFIRSLLKEQLSRERDRLSEEVQKLGKEEIPPEIYFNGFVVQGYLLSRVLAFINKE